MCERSATPYTNEDDSELELAEVEKHEHPATLPLPPPSWRTLPRKGQLAILALGRFADFFQMASLQSYMFYQLKSFDPTLSESALSWQTGVLQGSFTFMQVFTSILWGWLADRPYCGRKMALLIGLVGTGVSCIAVGFSKSFVEAVVWRSLGGAINGTVGASRTMLAENIKDKRYLPRAFLLLPMSFNFASFFAPVVSGWLADSASRHLISDASNCASGWIEGYPYALPGLLSAVILFAVAASAILGLDETLPNCDRRLILKRLSVLSLRHPFRRETRIRYLALPGDEDESYLGSLSAETCDSDSEGKPIAEEKKRLLYPSRRLPFLKIWRSNVVLVLVAVGVFDFHIGAFNGLLPVLLSSSRSESGQPRSVLYFSDGLAMTPAAVGSALAIIGAIGLALQFSLYPRVHQRLGTVQCFRIFSLSFPAAYFCAPYIALVPASAHLAVWVCITAVLFLQVLARTFSLPATILLINNCSPHASVLGTVHGVGQAVSAAARALGPIAIGYCNVVGMRAGMIAFAWWVVCIVALLGWIASLWARDGSTCQIGLEDDE